MRNNSGVRTLRHAAGSLLARPAFACIAIASLALGIGANTAIFSLWNAVSLRPLATRQPERLIGLSTIDARGRRAGFSYATFEKIRAHQSVLADLFAWQDASLFTLEAGGVLFPGTALLAGDGFPSVMPLRPVIGRTLAAGDGAVAVLGYDCWQRHFAGSPSALGQSIRIQGKPFTVVGVAPEEFTDMEGSGAIDAIVPLAAFTSLDGQRRQTAPAWEVTGRLRYGVTLQQARTALAALWPALRPDAAARLLVEPAATGTGFNFARRRFAYPLRLLLVLVGVLLLLASLNLAMLLLARAASRSRETAIRLALGAGARSILGEYLAESLLLSAAGALAGVLCARPASRFLAQFVWTGNLDRAHDYSIDGRVLAFTAAVALWSGLIFGVVPAWRALSTDPAAALQRAGRSVSASGRTMKALAVFQIALSVLLVLASTLFLESRRNLGAVPLGFRVQNLVEMQLLNRPGGYTGMVSETYYPELLEGLGRVPGVLAVASCTLQPVVPPLFPDEDVSAGGLAVPAQRFHVGPGYFATLGIPLLAGREFTFQDRPGAVRAAVISQSLARRLFADGRPVGRKVASGAQEFVVAGVARDSAVGSLQNHNALQFFTSMYQEDAARQPVVLVRTARAPDAALLGLLRREVVGRGREYPLRVETFDRVLERALVQERMLAALAAALGAAAVLLSIIGIYGLLSYSVARRSGEVAVRMAVGARRRAILWLIARESAVLLACGFLVSAPAAYAGSKLAAPLLFGFGPLRWIEAMGAVAVLFAAVVWGASALPAWRAASLSPLDALREM